MTDEKIPEIVIPIKIKIQICVEEEESDCERCPKYPCVLSPYEVMRELHMEWIPWNGDTITYSTSKDSSYSTDS